MDERVELLPRQQEEVSHHPALLAWRRLNPAVGEPVKISVLHKRFKSNTYRIQGPGLTTPSLVAKYCRREVAARERVIYEHVLPCLPVTVPRYFGFVEGEVGYDWLFLEYVEGQRYSRERRDHAVLAGRWLGILHTSAWSSVTLVSLPDLGPQHYLALLQNARGKLCGCLSQLHLPLEDLAVVRAVISQCDFLKSHWKQIERWSARMPRTLVHGDFKPRNVVIGLAGKEPAVFPFDWEAGGWGAPAEDLAYVDLASYHAAIQSHWPEVGLRELQCMKVLGRIFRGLSEFSWESVKFDPNWQVSTVKLQIYQARMAEAIEMARWGE